MFSIEAGKILGTAIANNDTLENLNLSWNAFRLDGAQAFAKGVAVSCNYFYNFYAGEAVVSFQTEIQLFYVDNLNPDFHHSHYLCTLTTCMHTFSTTFLIPAQLANASCCVNQRIPEWQKNIMICDIFILKVLSKHSLNLFRVI